MDWLKDALVPIALALVTGGFGYWWGRQGKVDEIRIKKIHELVQSIGTSFQVIHGLNGRLPQWFKTNFGAMESMHAGVERLRQFSQTLYADDAAAIERLSQEKQKLGALLLEARIYLPKSLCDDIEAYLNACAFGWSNVWPLFDTYVEGLFENLLDDTKAKARDALAERIMSGLQKAAS